LFHEDRELVVRTHREILSAIESRDPDRIRKATENHFSTSDGSFASIGQLIADGAD
jgi:DNA-binding GntR family transcriptional regulator